MRKIGSADIKHVVVLILENRGFDHLLGWCYDGDTKPQNVLNILPEGRKKRVQLRDFEGLHGIDRERLECSYEFTDEEGKAHVNTPGQTAPRRGARAANVPRVNGHESFIHAMQDMFGKAVREHANRNSYGPDLQQRQKTIFAMLTRKESREKVVKPDGRYLTPTMDGWTENYAHALIENGGLKTFDDEADLSQIMDMYVPEQLPVLNGLARHYAVSDQWFCSVPSQTNSNRAFLAAGCSAGMVTNNFYDPCIPIWEETLKPEISKDLAAVGLLGYVCPPIGSIASQLRQVLAHKDFVQSWRDSSLTEGGSALDMLPLRCTLFDLLKQRGISWRYYWSAPGVAPFGFLYPHSHFATLFKQFYGENPSYFRDVRRFDEDVKNEDIATVTYIEPIFGGGKAWAGGSGLLRAIGDDFHPACDTTCGEFFVKSIYDALSTKFSWKNTLLIITFDENGGTYDHFPPPPAQRPGFAFEPRKLKVTLGAQTAAPLKPAVVAAPDDLDSAPHPYDHPECEPPCDAAAGKPCFKTHTQFGFGFDLYGPRVPTILCSPWIKPGTVFRSPTEVPFDHTSIIATILDWLEIPRHSWILGARVANAPTFEKVLELETPRELGEENDPARYCQTLRKRPQGQPIKFGDTFYLRYIGSKWPEPGTPYRGFLSEKRWGLWKYPVLHPGSSSDPMKFRFVCPAKGAEGCEVTNGCEVLIADEDGKMLCAPDPEERLTLNPKFAAIAVVSPGAYAELRALMGQRSATTVWMHGEVARTSYWRVWLLAERDESLASLIHSGDEIVIFSAQTVPHGAWNLDYHAVNFPPPTDPYQRLAVDWQPEDPKTRYLKLRAGEWDIWKVLKAD